MMKAVRFHRNGGPEVLVVEEIAVPEPGPGAIRLRVEAAGVNYSDTVRRWGDRYPVPTPLPYVVGDEVAGVVDAVGPGVPSNLIGQPMLGIPEGGGYAQYAVVPLERTFPMPGGLAPEPALALLVQGLSAALILKEAARLRPGDGVLVEGAAGGVGSLAIQLARLNGAGTVIGLTGSAAKRDVIRAAGADLAIDHREAGWPAAVRVATNGRGVDVVLEMTGGNVFEQALSCMAPGGRLVVYGVASRTPFAVPSAPLIARNQSIIGFSLRHFFPNRALVNATLAELADLVVGGRLKVSLGAVLPLEQAAEAHRLLEGGRSTGKLVLKPNAA